MNESPHPRSLRPVRWLSRFAPAALLLTTALGTRLPNASAQARVIGWGGYHFDSHWPVERYSAIDGGGNHLLLQRTDGTVIGQGWDSPGQCVAPAAPAGLTYVQISAGSMHSAGLLSDGSIVAWGANQFGECDTPPLPAGLTYVEVSAGQSFTIGRRSDGSVVA